MGHKPSKASKGGRSRDPSTTSDYSSPVTNGGHGNHNHSNSNNNGSHPSSVPSPSAEPSTSKSAQAQSPSQVQEQNQSDVRSQPRAIPKSSGSGGDDGGDGGAGDDDDDGEGDGTTVDAGSATASASGLDEVGAGGNVSANAGNGGGGKSRGVGVGGGQPAGSPMVKPLNGVGADEAAMASASPSRSWNFLSGRSSRSNLSQATPATSSLSASSVNGGVAGGEDPSGGLYPNSSSTPTMTSSPLPPTTNGGVSGQFNLQQQEIATTSTILANPLPHSVTPPASSNGNGGASSLLSAAASSLPGLSSSGGGNGTGGGVGGAGGSSGNNRTFDLDDMINRLLESGYSGKVTKSVCLKNVEITAICMAAREVFLSQPTLIELSPPVKIVGDVHGQYTDLIRLFSLGGFPSSANYLFLGDYVDRGKQSLETILLLLCYKIKYPENFFLLRGNHECANVTRVYGFYDECKRRCNIKIWKTFIDVFNTLPICAIVASKIFCVHGGLSPSLASMDDIRRIQRPTDVPDYGLLNDLLWSDPSDTAVDWEDNERGVSYCFGKQVIQEFLAKYDFDLICRAHMVVEDGYEFWCDRMLVTIFSAPNYCGEFDNFASIMSVSEDLLCAFELLKPLDGAALKKEMAKSRRRASGLPPAIANAP